MCAPAHALRLELSLRRLSKTDQNATFTFVTLKGKKKKKNCHSQELYPQLDFFKKAFLKQEQSILLVLTDSPSSSTNIHQQKELWKIYFKA